MPASVTFIKYSIASSVQNSLSRENKKMIHFRKEKKYNHLLDCITLVHKSLMIPRKINY